MSKSKYGPIARRVRYPAACFGECSFHGSCDYGDREPIPPVPKISSSSRQKPDTINTWASPTRPPTSPGAHTWKFRGRIHTPRTSSPADSGNKGTLATRLNSGKFETMSISEIKKMSTRERLTAMEQLWDALCQEDQELDSPSWHAAVLAERKQRMDSTDARFFTLAQLRERFR